MYKVETHNNSREYYENLFFEKDAIYITANSSLSHMMREISNMKEECWRVIDIDNFTRALYPVWNDKINQIKLKAELRLDLLEVKNNLSDKNYMKEIQFLEDNLSVLYSDFTFLFECGLRKITYNPKEIKFKLLKEIFNKFVNGNYFKEVSRELSSFESFSNIGNKLIDIYINKKIKYDENYGKSILNTIKYQKNNIKRVYFYNVSYLDVNRYMLAEMLKMAGYEIIFRIPYFNNLKTVNENWNKIYKNNPIFDFKVNKQYSDSVRENLKYIEFLEGNNLSEYDYEDVTVKNYREIYDFKKDVDNNTIITFYKDSLESCMKRNELNLKDHCYQSSIGRFIFNLYNCSIDNGTVKISFDTYREMITSNWIEYKEWNGNRLSSYLMDNEEYFSGVRTIDEIIERIERIKDIEEIESIFENQVKNRIKKDNTKAFLSDPFRAFGYANLERYNITANYIYEVTLRLKRFILKVLEGKDEILDVKAHFENMVLLFRSSKYLRKIYKEGTELEQRILKRIFYVINNYTEFGEKIHKDEISELFYIYLYLDSKYQDEQEEDFSIDQLEGIIHRDKLFNSKDRKKLFLADLSYKAYEKYVEKYRLSGKIISDDELRNIFEKNLTGKNKEVILTGISLKEKSNLAVESYIKFALANLFINFNGKLEFSWISGLRNDDSKSIILKQIESIYENTKEVYQMLDTEDLIGEDEFDDIECYFYYKKDIKSEKRKLPEVAFKDLDFCGTKFLYSSLIQDYPVYHSDFHHKLLFSALVSMLKNSVEDGYMNIGKYVIPLFTQWEEVVKKNILDCEYSRTKLKEYKFFDGINYPRSIDLLYLLKSKYIVTEHSKIRNRYKKGEFNSDKYYDEFINEYLDDDCLNSGKHCMMCPHCYVCKKGEFVIDYK